MLDVYFLVKEIVSLFGFHEGMSLGFWLYIFVVILIPIVVVMEDMRCVVVSSCSVVNEGTQLISNSIYFQVFISIDIILNFNSGLSHLVILLSLYVNY